jgi:uncharacterized membrane protein YeaQ/YmgE (transglycosylase-associated protein family)
MRNFKTIYAISLGPAVLIILTICARLIHGSWTSVPFAYSLLVGVCGVVVGWLIGILASPYTRGEAKKFSLMATAIIGFLAGYAGTKIVDPVAEYLFKKGTVFSEPVTGANVLIFVSALVVSSINGYAYRAYFLPRDPKAGADLEKQGDT